MSNQSLVKVLGAAAVLAAVSFLPVDPVMANRCGQSDRVNNTLIMTGDSERKVLKAKPDREVRLETGHGGAAGFRFDFYERGVTIQIYTRSGVVIRICRVRD